MKTILILTLTGALLGVAVASYVVPPALTWYSAPGGLPENTEMQRIARKLGFQVEQNMEDLVCRASLKP